LQALAESFEFTKSWEEKDKQYYVKKMVSYLGLKKKDEDKKESAKIWQLLTKKYRGRVRSACLMFVAKFLQHVPKEVGEQHVQDVAPLVFEMVAEDNSIV
jgi:acyl-CoA hydrolase